MPHTFPAGTYAIRCQFPNSTREYTYLAHPDLVDTLHAGDSVLVETPRGFSIVTVTDTAPNDPAPVPNMKYIIARVAYTRWRQLQSEYNA